jgi:tRNA A37 threonylcarbamoyladenosine dehydratase
MRLVSDNLRDRDLRQRDIVPAEELAACHAVVIGVGAIGRQVALQLAAVGAPELTLFDDDTVALNKREITVPALCQFFKPKKKRRLRTRHSVKKALANVPSVG